MIALYLLIILMILGAIVALEARNLLSAIICIGIVGFGLVLVFLILQAPDLAIVQIVVETLSLIILVAAVLKTTREDVTEVFGPKKLILWIGGLAFIIAFLLAANMALRLLPEYGHPVLRMAGQYIKLGLERTGAANLVTAVILDFRGYDTLGEATVLFTAVMGVLAVLRRTGLKKQKKKEKEDQL